VPWSPTQLYLASLMRSYPMTSLRSEYQEVHSYTNSVFSWHCVVPSSHNCLCVSRFSVCLAFFSSFQFLPSSSSCLCVYSYLYPSRV
jgi:hypothetical protein